MEINDLTLIIPVRDRQQNISKQFEFYKDVECKKIIGDSSVTEYTDKKIDGGGFKYVYYGPLTVFKKLKYLADLIETKYMVFVADDDIVEIQALRECIKFLTNNPDYSACDGKYVTVHGGTHAVDGSGKAARYAAPYAIHLKENFRSDGVEERIAYHINKKKYYARYHGVLKTEVFKKISELYYAYPFMPLRSFNHNPGFDLVSNLIIAAHGNIKALPLLYSLRHATQPLIRQPHIIKELNLNAPSDGLSKECIVPIAEIVANKMNIKTTEACNVIKRAYEDCAWNFSKRSKQIIF